MICAAVSPLLTTAVSHAAMQPTKFETIIDRAANAARPRR